MFWGMKQRKQHIKYNEKYTVFFPSFISRFVQMYSLAFGSVRTVKVVKRKGWKKQRECKERTWLRRFFAWPDFSLRSHILTISRGWGGVCWTTLALITSVFLILLVCYPLHQRPACEVNMLFFTIKLVVK